MWRLLLLLLPVAAWAQDQVNAPDLVFDSSAVSACTSRKLVVEDLAFCTANGIVALVATQTGAGPTIPPETIPTTTTTTVAGTTTTSTTLAAANNYYVRPAGSDTLCDGTTDEDSPSSGTCAWATLTKAGAEASTTLGTSGVVVYVAPGTYTGNVRTYKAGSATQPVRFISSVKHGAKVVGYWNVYGPYQQIEQFELTAPTDDHGIYCYVSSPSAGHHCQILDNYIHDVSISTCSSAGMVGTGVATGTAPSSAATHGYNLVRGNIIRRGGSLAGRDWCNQFHGIYMSGPYDIAQNNLISGLIGWGIHAYGTHHRYQVIANNTIFSNAYGGILVGMNGDASPIYTSWDYGTISNNIVVNNGRDGIGSGYGIYLWDDTTGPNSLVSHNLLYGNEPANWAKQYPPIVCAGSCDDADMQTGANGTTFSNYRADTNFSPLQDFVSTDYMPKSGSTAIDTGTTACCTATGCQSPCAPLIDIAGTSRPIDAAYDIGVWEYNSATTTTTSSTTTTSTTLAVTAPPDWSADLDSALLFDTATLTTDSGASSGCTWGATSMTRDTGVVKKGASAADDSTAPINISSAASPECAAVKYTTAFVCGGWTKPSASTGTAYLLTKTPSTSQGYRMTWTGASTDNVIWRISDGSGSCLATTDTGLVDDTEWSHVAGIWTGTAMSVWVDGAVSQVDCTDGSPGPAVSCVASNAASCAIGTLANADAAVTRIGGDAGTDGVVGELDEWFCDDWDAVPSSDGDLDTTSLCRICSCGITGAGCTCSGTSWLTTGDRVGSCSSCTLPTDCTQARP